MFGYTAVVKDGRVYCLIPLEVFQEELREQKTPKAPKKIGRPKGAKDRNPRRKRKSWTQPEIDTLLDLYKVGYKLSSIAKKLGRSYHSIDAKLNQLKVKRYR